MGRWTRSEEFTVIQLESMEVVAQLRKALFSIHPGQAPSPVRGGFSKPPWARQIEMGLTPIHVGAAKVTDRRNSTLPCYFRHCG